jgi:hypothetical protein
MATSTVARPKRQTFVEEDVGNIMMMEHVNTRVPDQGIATLFYLVGMGFTRDPHMMVGLDNMWINVGEQQFHLPTGEPQVLRGHVGIVTPSLDSLAQRLEAVAPKLAGTKFSWKRVGDHIDAVSPWGNLLRCYEPRAEFGPMRMGIPYVEFTAPVGSAEAIVAFYDKALDNPGKVVKEKGGKVAVVEVGQYQRLRFRETSGIPAYDNHHIAVYIANFSGPYAFMTKNGICTEEPRSNHQFRFVNIVDPKTGQPVFEIEHEVRGMRHALYRRPLVNRSVGEFLEPRRVGNTTVMA